MSDYRDLNHGAEELSRFANDMADAISHNADEVGDNANSAYTVTSFVIATVDGKRVGVMAEDGEDWTFTADNADSVNLAERVRSVLDADGRSVLDDHEPRPPAADPSVQALLTIGQIDKRNRLIVEQCNAIANQAEALGENRVNGPHLAAARRILSNAETLVAYIEAPGSGLELVKTWSYSQINLGGADVTHGLTFTGTDAEWAEHLASRIQQGIEVYDAKEANNQ